MKIIQNERKEKSPNKAEKLSKAIAAGAEIYGKQAANKAATKNSREAFVKDNPVTKREPLPSFSTSKKSIR